jgi:hypothetical protein
MSIMRVPPKHVCIRTIRSGSSRTCSLPSILQDLSEATLAVDAMVTEA